MGKLGEQTCYYCIHVLLNAYDSTLGIILFTISITIKSIAINAHILEKHGLIDPCLQYKVTHKYNVHIDNVYTLYSQKISIAQWYGLVTSILKCLQFNFSSP